MDLSCSLTEFQNLGPLDLTLNLQLYFSMSNTSPVYISLILCLPEKLALYEWALNQINTYSTTLELQHRMSF